VGAPHDDNTNGSNAGAVFVFTKTSSSSTWTQMTQLLASDGAESDFFGISVSISKDASTIVVGAYYVDFNSNITDSGAAYMFRNINSTTTTTTTTSTVEWTQMGKFVAADRNTNGSLGSSIAMENNIVVVGAWGDDSGTGSVYVVDTGLSSSTPVPYNSTGAIVGVSAVVGVVVIVLGLGSVLAFFNYRIKLQREAREQQQQQALIPPPPPPPPPYSSNIPAVENTAAAAAADEESTTPIMADAAVVVVPPPAQEVRDETLEAAAFLDPATVAAAAAASKAAAAVVTTPTEKGLPRYKDQVRTVQPPGPSATNSPSSPKRNHQIHDPDGFHQQNRYPKEEEKEEEKEQSLEDQPPAVRPQQQQQLHRDPPAYRHPPSYQDRVDR
jgi:hypothetical protein